MAPEVPNHQRMNSLLIAGFIALSFSLSTSVQAQGISGEIDTKTSRVYTFVGKTGFGHEHAVIGEIKAGTLNLGARSNAGKIVFDMTTWKADTAEARKYIGLNGMTSASTQKDVNANMLGSSVLDVRNYPTATFDIASAVPVKQNAPTGKSFYQLDGKFTLHGVTRNLRLVAEVTEKKHHNHLRTSFTIKQTHFGITPYSKAFGAVGITDELKIYGEIDLTK
tara:strand:+ start:115755 stop:116420 length:666 start_codon:yes stop_codon:yes gene_type:complete